ncbi:MAG: hypothetical protein KC933_02070 [Myxococcales bacterium]|nr:hypothetical protein [Myxococcales bacterium]
MASKARWAVGLLGAVVLGFGAYVAKERAYKYHPYKDALFYALTTNDFAAAYATPADRAGLRAGFAFLGPLEGEEARVLALIEWLDAHVAAKETWSVHAPVLLEQRAGACEVHALAVAALGAYGIKARWISGVRDAIGFGYLEAFVDGGWRLYRLRADDAARVVGASALELYEGGETGVAVRAFYPQPDERLTSWAGPVEVGLLPLANLEAHPELRPLFEGPTGVPLEYGHFSPYDQVFDYDPRADDAWVREGVVMARLREMQARFRYTRRRALAALINTVDRVLGYVFEPGRVTGA